jgi:hypothetical protein
MLFGDPAATLLLPAHAPWYYENVRWLRQRLGDGAAGPEVCYTPCLCARAADRDYYRFGSGVVGPYAPDLGACPAGVEVPLGVALRYEANAGVLHWELSPEREGRWFYSRVPMFKLSPIPRRGSTPYLLKQPVQLQFFFESEAGWTTSTAVLTLDPANIDTAGTLRLSWSRGL